MGKWDGDGGQIECVWVGSKGRWVDRMGGGVRDKVKRYWAIQGGE